MDEKVDAWRAPYVSYETLVNFLERRLPERPLPPRIDPHFLDNYAGSVRPLLLTTLRTMDMLDDSNEVTETLRRVVAGGAEVRKQVMFNWAEVFYREQLELARANEVHSRLWDSFSRHDYSGSTLRKAVVFYLNLVEDLGLPNSPHFKAPKAQATGTGRRPRIIRSKPTGLAGAERSPGPLTSVTNQPPSERKVVRFGSSGVISIDVSIKWLDLPEETFVGLRRAIRSIEDLGNQLDHPAAVPPTDKGASAIPETDRERG